jgi:AcrR family transcriptional regulator
MFSPLSSTGLPTTFLTTRTQKYVCVLKAFDGYSKRVVHTRQEATSGTGGTLADTHEGKPGLPRGRSRLPAPAVQASQRERLLRAVVAAVAGSSYSVVTVADIVRRARVSRAAFYTHFTDKEDCFLAAAGEGGRLMDEQIVAATRAAGPGTPDEAVLRVAVRGFLAFITSEPEFAKIFYIDMPAAGSQAVDQLARAQRRYADLNQTWHERAHPRHPDWPTPPPSWSRPGSGRAGPVRSRTWRTRSSPSTWPSWPASPGPLPAPDQTTPAKPAR